MTEWQKKRLLRLVRLVETAAVLLFFYQALRALFSLLFGLIYDALFAGQVSMAVVGGVMAVVILALLAPLVARWTAAAPRSIVTRRLALLAGAVVVFLARIALTFDHFELRLAASILIVAATGFYLAVRLPGDRGHTAYALVLALVADQLLRAAGHTLDPTLRPAWWRDQVLVSLGLCLVSAGLAWRQQPEETGAGPRLGLSGLVWGGWLFLQTALLSFPNALARWSGEGYLLFALSWPFILLLTLLGSDLWRTRRGWSDGLLILVVLLGGLAAGYLLDGTVAFLGLLLAHLAATIALFSTFSGQEREGPEGDHRGPEPALALGNVLFLFLHLAYAFTFTYAYTLDLFRGLGLPVFALAALLVGVPLLRLPPTAGRASRPSIARWFTVCGSGVLVIAWILLVTAPQPHRTPVADGSFRAMTYNIHYGYDDQWRMRLVDQALAIEASGADVVMLQEVDTGRPTSYMIDNALWLAHRLDMQAVYLSTIEHLTGIALLSRYPVSESQTLLLPSELEQTGIIWAKLDAAGSQAQMTVPINAFGTWLGLEPEERARQLDAALPFLADPRGSAADPNGSTADPSGPAVFGGDFNATPDSPIYARIAGAGFVDPFLALGLDPPPTAPAVNPSKRIDFVWLRDLEPLAARVLDSTASDHRPVVVEAALP